MEGSQPFLPRGWFKWTFWQYSEKGRINGINANVDLNAFNGTLEELFKFANPDLVTEPASTIKKHKIVAGDSFESIAIKYGITVRELVTANPQLLKTGDALTIPTAVAIPSEGGGGSSTPATRTHTVKLGDTLYALAIRYGTTVAAIVSANNLANPNSISVGQVLVIP